MVAPDPVCVSEPGAQDEFGYSIARASLAFTCASLAYATFSPISGSIVDKLPASKRKHMIAIMLLVCGCSSSSILPYQLAWAQPTREMYAYFFCAIEGMLSTALNAPCLPDMHRSARRASSGATDEMTTNMVRQRTSILTAFAMWSACLSFGFHLCGWTVFVVVPNMLTILSVDTNRSQVSLQPFGWLAGSSAQRLERRSRRRTAFVGPSRYGDLGCSAAVRSHPRSLLRCRSPAIAAC